MTFVNHCFWMELRAKYSIDTQNDKTKERNNNNNNKSYFKFYMCARARSLHTASTHSIKIQHIIIRVNEHKHSILMQT